jgi:hypothetical protein
MSGSEVTAGTKMLAISVAPAMPHLHDPTPSLPMLPLDNVTPFNLLPSTKKPKLSLKTADLAPTFHGSVSRQAGINVNTATTPTTFNTFNNTFDLTYRPSPVSTVPSPGPQFQRRSSVQLSSPITRIPEQPYHLNLPFGVRSILKNSPIPWDIRRPSISASPRVSGRKMFFPAPKKVSFRPELEDEVVTREYVMRHADLSSSEDEESTASETDDQSSTSNDEEENAEKDPTAMRVDEVPLKGRRKRKSLATSPSPATDGGRGKEDGSRSTSVRRSKRKRRRWEWSLEAGNREEETPREEPSDLIENPESTATKGLADLGSAVHTPEATEEADISDTKDLKAEHAVPYVHSEAMK